MNRMLEQAGRKILSLQNIRIKKEIDARVTITKTGREEPLFDVTFNKTFRSNLLKAVLVICGIFIALRLLASAFSKDE